ncbi:hypothetical protein LSCM1_00442 [Leishmania martiniquensis]|uniref:Uncharacterized protein n=1 Tax=Leishmania martiniquensis TaxID=1580590 RepID=A0A836GSN3_9TRYP|nr:hypothetical protein LSCM1_00442 [Leishmania martiniquensis]
MLSRAVPRRLAAPAMHGRAQAAAPSPSPTKDQKGKAPLLQFPPFHPIHFSQDKFLSIKSRSLETYTKVRGDVLQRGADLCAQLQRQNGQAEQREREMKALEEPAGEGVFSPAAGTPLELPARPLTPHQAEELLLLTKKVEDLTNGQGFRLTDELVWRMLHLCIQCGAPQLAVDGWLQKHVLAEKRGPPFPLFVLEDLAATLRATVLPRLPESGASLTCSSALITASYGSADDSLSIAFEDGLAAAQRCLWHHLLQADWPTSTAAVAEHRGAAETFTAHLFAENVWPVWQALDSMKLTFADLRVKDTDDVERQGVTSDGHGSEGEPDTSSSHMGREEQPRLAAWLPDAAAQTLAVRNTLMSVTPLYSFHAPPSSTPPLSVDEGRKDSSKLAKVTCTRAHALLCSDPPFFPSEAAAIVAPLRALVSTWLVLAQCAAEAKDVPLLKAVLRTVCLGFMTHQATAAGGERSAAPTEGEARPSPVCVNENAWCRYAASDAEQNNDVVHRCAAEAQARAVVREFVNGVLSVLQYGLLCAEQEAALWQLHDTCTLIFGAAASLRSLQGPLRNQGSRSTITDDAKLYRMSAVALVQPAPAERADDLLRVGLPSAFVSSSRGQQDAGDGEHARALATIHALLSGALAHPSEQAAAHPYAEAALYVGLACGDESLLAQAASSGMAMSNWEATLLRRHARALCSYRRATARLAAALDGPEGHQEEAPEDDAWEAWTASLREGVSQIANESGAANTTWAQFVENSLIVLTLVVSRRATECATAYVRCIRRQTVTSAAEEGDNMPADDYKSHDTVEVEKQRREAIEIGWADLSNSTVACVEDMLNGVEQLLDASSSPDATACWLSPSSLSTLAVLARLGVYAEEDVLARGVVDAAASNGAAKSLDLSPSPLPLSTSLDRIFARMVRDACMQLRCASSTSPITATPAATTSTVGNWVQWVLLTLMARRAWTEVLAVLRALDGEANAGGSTSMTDTSATLLCSTTVDPAVFAALYARAVEDGAASVCAFLRPRRERLFF